MRASADLPQRRRLTRRTRLIASIVAVALVFLLLSLRELSSFYTDYLWFESVGYSSIWWGEIRAKVLLAVVFTSFFFAVLWLNLWVADRQAPTFRPVGPEEELLVRYHEAVGDRQGLVRLAVAAMFAFIAGSGVSAEWQSWLAFRNATAFAVTDPLFDRDVGFYVFRLPFLSYLVNWLFAALVIILLITAVAHYLNGGIRVQVDSERVTPQVKAHLSVLLAGLATVKALDYVLMRYELTVNSRGELDGAFFTDVNAQLPAIDLLLLISLFAVGLLIANIRRRGWALPGLAVGLWAFVAVVVGGIYPTVVERFQVVPQGSEKEAPFIERNIAATRGAYGLVSAGEAANTDIEIVSYPYSGGLTPTDIDQGAETLRNVRLLDPGVVLDDISLNQGDFSWYRFLDLDVDRYTIDGVVTPTLVAARELHTDETPGDSWELQRLIYTHGYGAVVAAANQLTDDGAPDLLMSNIPVDTDDSLDLELIRPEIYHGEGVTSYAVVGTNRQEKDGSPDPQAYEGDGGVALSSLARRAAFALRFWEVEPLISGFIDQDSSVILYRRDIIDRLESLAPFMRWDSDPYPVVADGRLVYMVDGYTTSDRYPYAQQGIVGSLPADSGLRRPLNYVRNSVKAVIDAYDGSVDLYRAPDIDSQPGGDPILATWDRAFPDLFHDFDEMPAELQAHIKYPEDLFRLQTAMWARYHLDEAETFFTQTNGWSVAQDPVTLDQKQDPSSNGRSDPMYQMLALPQADDVAVPSGQQFVLTRPFVPVSEDDSRRELTAYMVGLSDAENYGRLIVYEPEAEGEIPGPALIGDDMAAEGDVSTEVTLLSNSGSVVKPSDLLMVPIGNSLLYVRPLYTAAADDRAPQLEKVIVADGSDVAVADTLPRALMELFADHPESSQFRRSLLNVFGPGSLGTLTRAQTIEDNQASPNSDRDPGDETELEALLADIAQLGERAEDLRAQIAAEGEAEDVDESGSATTTVPSGNDAADSDAEESDSDTSAESVDEDESAAADDDETASESATESTTIPDAPETTTP